MKPKQKAKELVEKYLEFQDDWLKIQHPLKLQIQLKLQLKEQK